jgi:hypothetical protein
MLMYICYKCFEYTCIEYVSNLLEAATTHTTTTIAPEEPRTPRDSDLFNQPEKRNFRDDTSTCVM